MTDLQKLQQEIYLWSNATFGIYRNALPIAYHLQKEVGELIAALKPLYEGVYSNDKNGTKLLAERYEKIKFEFADCLMLLMDSAAHLPLTMDGLVYYTARKLEINKARKWHKPDENGVSEHQMTEDDLPEIDFRKDIAMELSRDQLIDRLCEFHEAYTRMRAEWLRTMP